MTDGGVPGASPGLSLRRGVPDLTPAGGAAIQWWFVQGEVAAAGRPPMHFMVALFRLRLAEEASACMLLAHGLSADGARASCISRITGSIPEAHRAVAWRVATAHLGRRLGALLLARHMRAARAEATAAGITLVEKEPRLAEAPFRLDWGDVLLAQAPDGIRLRLPLDGGTAEVLMVPERPVLAAPGPVLDPGFAPPFTYLCCPRLALRGHLAGRGVTGRAWLDRQWGALDGWFLAETAGGLRPVGWDWAGLSFDSGEDLLAMRHDIAGGPPLGEGFAVLFGPDGAVARRAGVVSETLRAWRSPRTGIAYPVARRLRVPALAAELDIVPLADDQEIPVFGAPAIWQGAVSARGRIGARRVAGTGRLEMFGRGYGAAIARRLPGALARWLAPGRGSRRGG